MSFVVIVELNFVRRINSGERRDVYFKYFNIDHLFLLILIDYTVNLNAARFDVTPAINVIQNL